jgi:3-oxoacyl-[acyl-carrier-protein] synthase III
MLRCRLESLGVSLPRTGLLRWGSLYHAARAGNECLVRSHYRRSDIQVLINSGVHRDGHVCEPAIATYVLRALRINAEFRGARTLGFDLQNGGCGMLNAAHVLATMMQAGDVRVGMIVSSEANSDERPDPAFPYPASGAAALVDISPFPHQGFGAFAFRTHEEHAEAYSSVVSLAAPHGRIVLRRRAELEDLYLDSAGEVVEEVLARDQLHRDQISCVVPAQLSSSFVGRLGGAIGLPDAKIVDLTDRLPDTLSTSVFLALHEARRTGRVQTGQRALLMAFGSGLTVGAAVYRF